MYIYLFHYNLNALYIEFVKGIKCRKNSVRAVNVAGPRNGLESQKWDLRLPFST